MPKKITLKAIERDAVGKKMRSQRKEGKLPAVVYGHGVASRAIWLSALDFSKIYQSAGESTLIELSSEGTKSVNVLIHDTQTDPLSGSFTHIDLLQVRMDEVIETGISLEFVGESLAVKALGGMFLKNIDEVEVSCLPADLPRSITVDISVLKTFDDHITAGDLHLPEKVTLLSEADLVVAGVTPPRTEAEVADLDTKAEADVTKVEGVIKDKEEKVEEK